MKWQLEKSSIIAKLAPSHGGVFSINDLKNIFKFRHAVTLYRGIDELERHGALKKFVRGYYVTPAFNAEILSQRLCEKSYLSFGTVLAKEMVIGAIPAHTVYAVKIGKNRQYKSSLGQIQHLGVLPRYFFGFHVNDGVAIADKEKALLDTLYFYLNGFKFSFNIYQDINTTLLNKKKVATYLKQYRNPKFIQFVKGVMDG